MSYYAGAHNFSIGQQYITSTSTLAPKNLFDYLSPHITHGAAHNSNDRRDSPPCHEETRVAIQQDIIDWIKHDEGEGQPRRVMWLSGPAGAGKSAIAGSIAKTCQIEGMLAATFFFSSFSSVGGRYSRGLVATLVHHIAQNDSVGHFRDELLKTLELRPDIFHKTLEEQAECLILTPFRRIGWQKYRTGGPKAVIIDGLDEIQAPQDANFAMRQMQRTSEDDQIEVLGLLLTLCHSPHFPFRIFVASRPEKHIADFFTEAQSSTVALFLDSKYNPDADIRRFLVSKFTQIKRRWGITSSSWPGQSAVDRIVNMSSGQFVVPTTIIRWVEGGIPQQQLEEVLEMQPENVTFGKPFATLDALYRHILMRPRYPLLVVTWIRSVTIITGFAATFWRRLFENVEGEFNYHTAPVLSLMSIPQTEDTLSPIGIYHKSLVDYLETRTRCEDLYVSLEATFAFISHRTAELLSRSSTCLTPIGGGHLLMEVLYLQDLAAFDAPGFVSLEDLRPRLITAPGFLDHLPPAGREVLLSCDVVWWTKVCLQPRGRYEPWPLYDFILRMYCGIHQALECNGGGAACHPACVHWRTGISAGAKELGCCVHRLEGVPVDDLEDLTLDDAKGMLMQSTDPPRRPCYICHSTQIPPQPPR